MNLRQRMQHQNRNNSSIMNASGFEFSKVNKEDQIYERSRRDCEEELYKRRSDLEYERSFMMKNKEKQMNHALDKFNADFEEFRKQTVNMVNQQLTQMKARIAAQIRQRRSGQTIEEGNIKRDIEELLEVINSSLAGLKKEQYRDYIAKIVTSDFDSPREDIKIGIKKLKYPVPALVRDEKHYQNFKESLQKMVSMNYHPREEGYRESKAQFQEPRVNKYQHLAPVSMHENRNKLKEKFQM